MLFHARNFICLHSLKLRKETTRQFLVACIQTTIDMRVRNR